jgi:HD superfamily phosphohydrolase YqeK
LQYEAEQNHRLITAASNTYDHGLIGYELLKQNPKYNDPRILFALKWHGKTTSAVKASADWKEAEKRADFNDLKQILFLVRDADKLANLHHIKADNHLEKDLFYRQLTEAALQAPLSPKVLEEFYQKRTVSFLDVYSFADRVLMVLSWMFDLNYQTSVMIFNENDYAVFLVHLLKKYHHNAADITEIQAFIQQT